MRVLILGMIFGTLTMLLTPSGYTSERKGPLIEFTAGSFSQDNSSQVLEFKSRVEQAVPSSLLQAFDKPVEIQFDDFDLKTGFALPSCRKSLNSPHSKETHEVFHREADVRYGRVSPFGNKILLNPHFKEIILHPEASAETFNCGHGNAYRLALATVIHELAHLYDYKSVKNSDENTLYNRCLESPYSDDFKDPHCVGAKYLALSVSSRKEYALLAGWSEQGVLVPTTQRRNFSHERSVDAYEFKNLEESFAVNFEFYTLDREFKCRKPLLYEYLSEHFKWKPFADFSCIPTNEVTVQSGDLSEPNISININPSRVYQIHYLFAAKGDAMLSKWGHAMYRIIMCSPQRQVVGPECLADISHHIVVSFRANVADMVISSWKGLVGDYPSQMFLLPMLNVIQEYTAIEARDLISVPLKLSSLEKDRFILNVLSHFWSYQGRYRFLSGNCANESLWFLQMATFDSNVMRYSNVTTPVGLYDELAKNKISDTSILSDEKKALDAGYFFKSKRPQLVAYFKSVSLYLPYFDIDDYAKQSTAVERRNYFVRTLQGGLLDPSISKQKFAARFFAIELYIQSLHRNDFQLQIVKMIEGNKEKMNSIRQQILKIFSVNPKSVYRAYMGENYGIPLQSEIDEIKSRNSIESSPQLSQEIFQTIMRDPLLGFIQPAIKELKEIEFNLLFFRKNLTNEKEITFIHQQH